METISDLMADLEREMASLAVDDPRVKLLLGFTGIDYYRALLLIYEIDDITRFSDPKKLVSYIGLAPSLYQSGDSLYHGSIKHGNRKVQTVMIQAAKTAARTDERMRTLYTWLAKRHGHNISITHVANKMMTIIWYMLTQKRLYNEKKEDLYKKKLKRIESQYQIS